MEQNLNFGEVIELLKEGRRLARSGWNGKNMYIFLRKGRLITEVHHDEHMVARTGKTEFESRDHICMKDSEGKCVVGWLASQTDMLASDWNVVP